MCKVAFFLGPFTFYWYGLFLSLSILIGMLITWFRLRQANEPPDIMLDLVLIGAPIGIIFARVFYVIANWRVYQQDPLEIMYIWQGGLDMYGSLVGIIISLYFYSHFRGVNFRRWADLLSPGLAAGYIVSRWGNFFTQENFGLPTDASWGIYIDFGRRPEGYEQYDFFHPVFLYETIAGTICLTIILAIIYINRRHPFLKEGSLFPVLLVIQLVSALLISFWQYDLSHNRLAKLIGGSTVMLVYFLACRLSLSSAVKEDIQEE